MLDFGKHYVLKKSGLLDYESISFLKDFYLPLVSHDGVFLYVFLLEEIKGNHLEGKIDDLLNDSTMSAQDFMLAKKCLESVGLLNTYRNEDDEYLFVLNDPLTPKNFIKNLTLRGLLIQTIGNDRFEELKNKYAYEMPNLKKYKDESARINDSFEINFDADSVKKIDSSKFVGRNKSVLNDSFSDVKLINYISKNSQLTSKSFSLNEIEYIHAIGSLYGLKEDVVGHMAIECYVAKEALGNRLDQQHFKQLANTYVKSFKITDLKFKKTKIDSDSDWARRIKVYEETSPRAFLKGKQNGIEVTSSDLSILEELRLEYGFTNGMINALIDYVLEKQNGDLNRNYIMKIAATLIRKKVGETLDVINALHKNESAKSSETAKEKKVEEEEYEFTDEELENL